MTATWGKRLFQSGAVVLVVLGLVHSLAVINTPVPANDTERQLFQLMNDYKSNLMGSLRSTSDLFRGFNICFVIFPIVLGVLDLALSGERPGLLKKLALINTLGLVALTANSVYNWFAAPTAFLAVALVLFAAAWMKLSPERSS